MKRGKTFRVKNAMYPFQVVFHYGPRLPDRAVASICRRYGLWDGQGDKPACSDGDAFTASFGAGCFVWIDSHQPMRGVYGDLVHELVHVLTAFQEHIGVNLCRDSDELHAYFAGWLVDEFMRRVR